MAAKAKSELVDLTIKEFAKLQKLLDGIDDRIATVPHPDDGITIKDTILHRVHWIDLFLGWYRDGAAGRPVETPAPGYKWNQLKEYNALVRERTRDVSWDEAKTRLGAGHTAILGLIQGLDDSDLYTTGRYDWTNTWTLGRWAEASGPSHYRSAAKYVREIVRKTAQAA